jgi:hypothetical protein
MYNYQMFIPIYILKNDAKFTPLSAKIPQTTP